MQLGSMLFGSFVIETKLFGPMIFFTHEKITIVIINVTAIVKKFLLIIIIANKIENYHDHDCKIALLPGPPPPQNRSPQDRSKFRAFFFLLPPQFSFFFPSLGVLTSLGPHMCTFAVLAL